MATICPQCRREFDDAGGVCPFDGAPLGAQPTPAQASDNLAITIQGGAQTITGPMAVVPRDLAVTAQSATPSASLISRLADADVHTGDGATGDDFVSLRDIPSTTAAMRALDLDSLDDLYTCMIGSTLDGRYAIEQILGEGGMGLVFLARHVLLEKPVAIKVLKREVADDQEVITRFLREARSASSIGHPSIVEFTDFGTTPDGLTYSVMEYVEGPTLDQVLAAEGPLPAERVIPFARKLAEALAAAHSRNIVHRDLKPENIFLYDYEGTRDQVKVVDFGIAKVLESSHRLSGAQITADGAVFGTAEYIAPEQASGRRDIDHRVDIYSLGIILYEMLTHHVPHKTGNMMRTLAMRVLDPIKSMREIRPDLNIAPELDELVLGTLTREPEQRLASMDDFLARLDDLPASVGAPVSPGQESDHEEFEQLATTPYLGHVDDLMAAYPEFRERGTAQQSQGLSQTDSSPAPDPQSGRGWAVLALLMAALAGGLVGFLLFGSDRGERDTSEQAPVSDIATPIDAAVEQPHRNDEPATEPGRDGASESSDPASSEEHGARAAGSEDRTGAAGSAKSPESDAGWRAPSGVAGDRPRDTDSARAKKDRVEPVDRAPEPVVPAELISITVLAQPNHASLYVEHNYSGKGGTTFQRPKGTEFTVECRLKGHQTGRVRVRFDGQTDVFLCATKRVPKCVDGLKNPFDKCPD